jgi:hypothetical protein
VASSASDAAERRIALVKRSTQPGSFLRRDTATKIRCRIAWTIARSTGVAGARRHARKSSVRIPQGNGKMIAMIVER